MTRPHTCLTLFDEVPHLTPINLEAREPGEQFIGFDRPEGVDEEQTEVKTIVPATSMPGEMTGEECPPRQRPGVTATFATKGDRDAYFSEDRYGPVGRKTDRDF